MNSYDYNCLRKEFISIVIQISFSTYEFFIINKKYLFKLKKINFIDFMEWNYFEVIEIVTKINYKNCLFDKVINSNYESWKIKKYYLKKWY